MKKLTLLTLIIFQVILTNAQEGNVSRHHFRTGLNMTLFATQITDINHPNYDYYVNPKGPGLNVEYYYMLNKFLSLSSRVGFSQSFKANSSEYLSNAGNPVTKNLTSINNMFYSNLSLRLCPLPQKLNWLRLELGAIYSNINGDFSSNLIYADHNEADDINVIDNNFGLLGAIDITALRKNNYEIGLRTELISSYITNSNKKNRLDGNAWLFGLYVGF